MHPSQITIGELLRRHRLSASLTQKQLAQLIPYSNAIISRVEGNLRSAEAEYLTTFMNALELPEEACQEIWSVAQQTEPVAVMPSKRLREDWGEAPDVTVFYGRQEELAELTEWIVDDRCRLIAILGMGGIGKTTLAIKLAQQIKGKFDYIIWRSLRSAPPIEEVLTECIKLLADQQINLSTDVNLLFSLFLSYLRRQRCLIILDNGEAILQEEQQAGFYRLGYEMYGQLLQRVGETIHQSCVVITSREKPKEFVPLAGPTTPVRSMVLTGLKQAESRELIKDRELFGDEAAWIALTQRYIGNPLALRQVSASIQDLYGGDITTFLEEITTMFGDIRYLLEQQFNRLSPLEQEVMYWLAIERDPISLPELQEDLVHPVTSGELLEALEALQRRSLIEKSSGRFTLQNVITEYLTERLIERTCEEIVLGKINLFQRHALIKAEAKAYIRDSQLRLILKPIANQLLMILGRKELEYKFKNILSKLRKRNLLTPNYAAGNVLNLLIYLKSNLKEYDFSQLAISQAYLRGVNLPDVSFVGATFAKSIFSEIFGIVSSVTFNPRGDLLAAGTGNGEIWLWSPIGQPFLTCKGHTTWVDSVAFSPDGHLLASGGYDRTVKLWEVKTGQCLQTLIGHTNWIRSVAFNPEGTFLATGSYDRTVKLWEVETGQCVQTLTGHTDLVMSVAFSPDGHLLASGSYDRTVKLWEVETGQCVQTLTGHTDLVMSVAFSPDGHLLASGSYDRTVKLWEVKTGQCLRILTGHTDWIRSVSFNPEGTLLASSSYDRTVKLWEAETGQCFQTLTGHTDLVMSVAFNPKAEILVSGSYDRTVKLWEIETGQCFQTLTGHTDSVMSVAFSPDGHLLASGGYDPIVKLWEVETGQCLQTLSEHTNLVMSVAFSPNGHLLTSGGYDRTVKLWEVETGQCLHTLIGHTDQSRSVVFSPGGHLLASGSYDRTVKLWEVETGQCLNTLIGHTDLVMSVVFSPGGHLLASGSCDRTLKLWEVETGLCLQTLTGHTDSVMSVVFSPDGHLLATGGCDRTLKLWEAETGQCLQTLTGHTNWIRSIAFSLDGHLLASSSYDQTVKLWEVKTGHCLNTLTGHTDSVMSVAFSPISYMIATGSLDGTVKLWNSQTGECLQTFQSDRPYERMNITGVTGLTEAQKASLKALGAIEIDEQRKRLE